MSESRPVALSGSGPPETVLGPEDAAADAALAGALSNQNPRATVAAVLEAYPRHLDAWARLGDLGRDAMESYAAYRVGYHRGLDRLRQSGWRGSGYVRWRHPTNRGFLRALAGLARVATEIGEEDEAERCELFLRQLDPSWPGAVPDDGPS
ncbi:MAG: DUF3151 family protein [Actinomycetota bacterium]|nr:DUF3151 family protein [Actinomycetota bacterium]MED6328134.1 DUF3151 family protein [Actinomycetota bacterium]